MTSSSKFGQYLNSLHEVNSAVVVTDDTGSRVEHDSAIGSTISLMHSVRDSLNKIIFVGNGGSAAIASHMAIDYSKNGRLPAVAMNDGAALTCLANDLGYENVFAEQIDLHGREGDLLIAISSSGASENILKAVTAARRKQCHIVTMSGFSADNPLRQMGSMNWYIESSEYGFVEVSHLTICHAILDIEMGWSH